MRQLSLWVTVLWICAVLNSMAGAARQLRQEFKNPPKTCRPMVRWWWPGGDVTDEELRREVRLLDEANFGGGEIQPFRIGLNPKMPEDVEHRVNDYLTPSFFGHVTAALEEAQNRGMWLDLTLGSGWPFGGGDNITPELASMELRFAHQTIAGPAKFRGKLTMPQQPPGIGAMVAKLSGTVERLPEDWARRLKERERLIAIVALRGEEAVVDEKGRPNVIGMPETVVQKTGILDPGSAAILTSRVSPDGTLEWDVPEGKWQVFTFVQFPADLRVIGGVGDAPQFVLDHLKREAIDSHIQAVGERAREHAGGFFGKGLRAIFCDSLEVHAYLFWTDRFLEDFRRLRGYDLTPFLPLLKVPGFAEPYGAREGPPLYDSPGIGGRVRRDYWQTVSDVMIANFYQPLADWAKRNSLLARVQAHGAQADVLRIYGLSHIPETENLYDGGRYDFLKYAASGSHVYGRPVTASESFVWMGKAYQTTPEKIKWRADELITAGINEIIYHGFPYEYMDRPEPGWHPFSAPLPFSSHMNQHNPFWQYLGPLNAYITRLQYISQNGENVAPVALYQSKLAYDSKEPQPPEPEINTRLMEAGYNFDHINTDALLKSRVTRGKLVSPGGASYGQLILLNEQAIPVELAEKLAEFVKQGLPLLFVGRAPEEEAGYADFQAKTEKIRSLMRGALEARNARLVKSVEEMVPALGGSVQPNLKFLTPQNSVFFIEKKIEAVDFFFLRNGSTEPRRVEVEFPVSGGSPAIWDPWSGDIQPCYDFRRDQGGVRMEIDLPPYGSRLIAFDAAVKHSPRAPAKEGTELPAVTVGGPGQKWMLHAYGKHGDGRDDIHDLELTELVDWSQHDQLRHFSGKGRYTIRFQLPPAYLEKGTRVELELGDVKDVAEVRMNGQQGPTLLLRPYRADVTSLAQPGENTLEVTVTNTLFNRLTGRGMNLTGFPGQAAAKPVLLPSGLMGPVKLIARSR